MGDFVLRPDLTCRRPLGISDIPPENFEILLDPYVGMNFGIFGDAPDFLAGIYLSCLGLSQYALLHFGQITGRSLLRGTHACPHRAHSCCVTVILRVGIPVW